MASMEKIIKEETDKIVEKYKQGYASSGIEFNSVMEMLLRQGIAYGVTFASMALANVPSDIFLGENK